MTSKNHYVRNNLNAHGRRALCADHWPKNRIQLRRLSMPYVPRVALFMVILASVCSAALTATRRYLPRKGYAATAWAAACHDMAC